MINSVQQHNVIHFKQPVKPVIILQSPKQQQRAELIFNPPEGSLTNDVANDVFYQGNDGITSIPGDVAIDPNASWHGIINDDSTGHQNLQTAQDRSPPPYFQAVAGRSSSIPNISLSTSSNMLKSNQKNLPSPEGGSSLLGHRRSLSVPVVSLGTVQAQELQKGQKAMSMSFDFAETDENACDMGDNYQGITQELQKVMMIEAQSELDPRNTDLLDILGVDALYPATPGSISSSSGTNMNTFQSLQHGRLFNSCPSPKRSRSPTSNLPTYQEAVQHSFCVQSPTGTSNFNTNDLLNGYNHEQTSAVNIRQAPPGKVSSSDLEDNLIVSPGSPMRVDGEDVDLLQRGVLGVNGYRRDSLNTGELRTHEVRSNSLYPVNPNVIFGTPLSPSGDLRALKQEDGLAFLDIDPTVEFPDSMDFGMGTETGISIGGMTFIQ